LYSDENCLANPVVPFVVLAPQLESIRFCFDRRQKGVIILDRVGFACLPDRQAASRVDLPVSAA